MTDPGTYPNLPRVIRVFVSSTFPPSLKLRRTSRDMQAERDYLVKFVFPELRKLCELRGVRGEVDLRWGLTSQRSLLRHEEAKHSILVSWTFTDMKEGTARNAGASVSEIAGTQAAPCGCYKWLAQRNE